MFGGSLCSDFVLRWRALANDSLDEFVSFRHFEESLR